MNIKKLDKNYKRQIAEIASNCFIDDPYFDYLSNDKTIKKEKLIKIYESGVDITLRHGDIFGALNNDKLAGFVMMPNYNSLKNNSQDYNKIFSLSSNEYNSDIIEFINYANNLKNPQYLLAICVNPKYQKQGIGYNLVKHIVQVYKDQEIISDVDNKNSLSIYKKLDFNIKQLSEKFYYVNKNNSIKLIEVNEKNKKLAIKLQETIFPKDKSPQQILDGIKTKNPLNFICYYENEPVGIVGFYFQENLKSHILLNWYGVKKEYRNKGLGATILKESISLAKSLKRPYLSFWTSTNHKEALNLYKKIGFEINPYSYKPDIKDLAKLGINNNFYVGVYNLYNNNAQIEFDKIDMQIAKQFSILSQYNTKTTPEK